MFFTLAVITALCLLIPFTRTYGVIGLMILLYFYTQLTLILLGVPMVTHWKTPPLHGAHPKRTLNKTQ